MKKTAMILFMMMIGLSVFAQNGVIREINGTVELKQPGAAGFVAAANGDVITQETVVSTGFRSTALVEVGSAVIALRPLTRLTLKEISASSDVETLNVDLQAGRVRVDVNPPAGSRASVTVASPSATASVRGTSFLFDTINLTVLTGDVGFEGANGLPVTVHASSTSSITEEGKATNAAYVYTRPASSSIDDSNNDSESSSANAAAGTSGDGGFVVGGMTGGTNSATGGPADTLLPTGVVGSDPGSAPIIPVPTEPIVSPPPVEPPPVEPPPIEPPPVEPPPVEPPPVEPPPVEPPPTTPPETPPPSPPSGGGTITPSVPNTGGVGIDITYS